jgi:two-component system response regulator HydG
MNSVSRDHAKHTTPVSAVGVLLGASPVMQEVLRLIGRVAPTEGSVLLTGESGSGKAFAARSIHERSVRSEGPFVAINCGALPAGRIESELFGHETVSLEGVIRAQPGVFERAEGGTLLLDEISAFPLEMQTRLLRVIETRKLYRVGSNSELETDVRLIATTDRCPLQAVQSGRLREDLLYRLAVFPIEMPPLRDRGDDVELLAEYFLAELNAQAHTQKRLSAAARMTLISHSWPGNVLELKNCIERAFILGDTVLELVLLVQSPVGRDEDCASEGERLNIRVGSRIYDMERSLIVATLDYFKGNKRRAADALGCSLKTLYNKLNGYSQNQECAHP